ncbi:hypothetical protein E2C01_102650 [Portunus trituberculatus]|uniref:Uncharacterized protein n=1 Tax=Portunus trituberculatus TaxID=210409 RepID=A0A5B7KD61_PORTR|nr:hypothetical protein [Portunus trituberculatus]
MASLSTLRPCKHSLITRRAPPRVYSLLITALFTQLYSLLYAVDSSIITHNSGTSWSAGVSWSSL